MIRLRIGQAIPFAALPKFSRRLPSFAAALVLLWAAGAPSGEVQAAAWVEGDVIVSFAKDATGAQKAEALRLLDARIVKEFPFVNAALYRLQSATTESVIGRKWSAPGMAAVEPNLILEPDLAPNDPLFASQWYLHHTAEQIGTPGADIRALHAWDVERGSPDVVVGVIDAFFDLTHPDLAPNLYTNAGEVAGNGLDDDHNGYIDDVHGISLGTADYLNPHGTLCAGAIAAQAHNGEGISGVADISLMPLAVGSEFSVVTAAGAIEAMGYAIMMDVDVLSMSLGSYESAWLTNGMEAACRAASDAGIWLVFSAGNRTNTGNPGDPMPIKHYPACYDIEKIISVGGTDQFDTNIWNAHPDWVDLAAPSANILSCTLNGGYAAAAGTSLACPQVAGVMALILSKFGDQPGFDAKARLLETVDVIPALAGKNATGGRLNAFLAVADADSLAPGQVGTFWARSIATNRVGLEWTAAGDDGNSGNAARYDIRISTAPITSETFEAATPLPAPPAPAAPGTLQALPITGLEASTTYHVAMRVLDEWGSYQYRLGLDWSRNVSALSTTSFTTLASPTMAVYPTNLKLEVAKGTTGNGAFEVINAGAGILDFTVSALEGGDHLAFTPAAWSLAPGEVSNVIVAVNVDAEVCGTVRYALQVQSNDPVAGLKVVSLAVMVTGTAEIELAADVLDFGGVIVGESRTLPITVWNRGCDALLVQSLAFSGPEFAYDGVEPIDGSPLLRIEAGTSATLPVKYRPLDYSIAVAEAILTTSDGDQSRTFVELRGQGLTYPHAALEATTLRSAPLTTGGREGVGLRIANTGGAELTFAFGEDLPPWLTVTPASGVVAGGQHVEATFTFAATGLCAPDSSVFVMTTNSPGQVTVPMTAAIEVAPGAELSAPNGLTFGSTSMNKLAIINIGCAGHALTITGISIDDPAQFRTTASFPRVVQPGLQTAITLEMILGGTTIARVYSDDPNHPVHLVQLSRELEPPTPPVAAVEVAPGLQAPGEVLVMPNPFNPSTTFAFRLDRDARVSLSVYDLRGRRIRGLDVGARTTGEIRVTWDGRSDAGESVPSGTYFYQLRADGVPYGRTGKITLLK